MLTSWNFVEICFIHSVLLYSLQAFPLLCFHPDVPNRVNGQQYYSPQWAADVAAQKREMSIQVTNVRRVQRHASLLFDNRSKRDNQLLVPPMVTVADVSVTCALVGPKLVTGCEIHY